MKILFVGPKHGGINAYTKRLIEELQKDSDVECKHIGTAKISFDLLSQKKIIDDIYTRVLKSKADIIHFQFGTYDIEQLLLLPSYKKILTKAPTIYTVHNLDWRLLKKMGYLNKYNLLKRRIRSKPVGYIFFGKYSQKKFNPNKKADTIISHHPATFQATLFNKKIGFSSNKLPKKFISLLGYSSRWKDHKTLLKALEKCNERVQVVIAGKWWFEKLGFSRKKINNTSVYVISKELKKNEIINIIKKSKFGLFSYKKTPDFQCSGILPMYAMLGKNVVTTSVGCLPEYVDSHSFVIPQNKPAILAKKIDLLWKNESLNKEKISKIKKFYKKHLSWEKHIKEHLNFYEKIYNSTQNNRE